MEIRYYKDPRLEQPHIYSHGVSESEVEDILARPGEDRPGSDGSRVATGQTHDGRYVRVVYVPDEDDEGLFVVTAYELKGKPLLSFRRRMRRKQK